MIEFEELYESMKGSQDLRNDLEIIEMYANYKRNVSEEDKVRFKRKIEELNYLCTEEGIPVQLENHPYIQAYENNFVEMVDLNIKVNQNKEVRYLRELKEIIETLEDAQDTINIKEMYQMEYRNSDYTMMDRVIQEIKSRTMQTEEDIEDF